MSFARPLQNTQYLCGYEKLAPEDHHRRVLIGPRGAGESGRGRRRLIGTTNDHGQLHDPARVQRVIHGLRSEMPRGHDNRQRSLAQQNIGFDRRVTATRWNFQSSRSSLTRAGIHVDGVPLRLAFRDLPRPMHTRKHDPSDNYSNRFRAVRVLPRFPASTLVCT